MYVLDGQMQLVPPGTLGQLYIGGPGVARGYCNYPQLTAEKFVPDPFSSEPGRRLYQTGDIVRIASSNDLVFCGRTDNQVKIRGFRIELGEIESVLNQHPQVQTSAAVAHVFPDNEREVVAYFVPKEQPGPTPRQLHNFVTERLPRYMVPAAFVPLDALPLNNNGKLDYKALPDPNLASEQDTSKNSRPRTLEELRLCEIWEEVLGVAIRDVTTSFFEVGGNSLLMVALGARIEQVFGTCLSVATLYESDTITSQAAQLRENGVRPPFSCLVPIQPLGNKRLLYLIHPGGGMVHCYFELGREFRPDQPLMALQSLGLDAGSEPHTTIEAMSQHYVDLIIAAQPEGPYRLGGWSLGGVVAFEMAREFVRRGHIVDRLFLLDTSCPGAFGPMSAYDVSDTELLLGIVGLPEGCGIAPDEFSRLTLDAQLTLLLNHAQETRSGMSSLELADARRLFEVLRRNTLAVREYVAGPYEGEITLYRAAEETNPLLEPTLGWDRWAQVEMVTVPGTHQKMLDANIVSILASSMKTRLSH
jgi:thioesterase domain-containing protein